MRTPEKKNRAILERKLRQTDRGYKEEQTTLISMTAESGDPGILAPINFKLELGLWQKFRNLCTFVAMVNF